MRSDQPPRQLGVPVTIVNEPEPAGEHLRVGSEALARGAWQRSFDAYLQAVDTEESSEALEGLATAAWWLDDVPALFPARERAYRLYRRSGERRGAARMAIALGLDHYVYRGDLTGADGWLRRAHRLLKALGPTAEHGWLAVWEAHIALMERNDAAFTARACAEALALAEALDLIDLGVLALALSGLALVTEGKVADGMSLLDEAATAALAGEMTDVDAIVTTFCYHIYACERVRDYPRAVAWCERVAEVSRRWAYRSMFAYCRGHYAGVLIWKGEWAAAERELTTAMHDLLALRPSWVSESFVRLAEVRRRQGRLDEAATLLDQVASLPHAVLGTAELALDRGDAVTATDLVDRFLRRIPPEDCTERATGLEVAVRAWIARGDMDRAEQAATELETTACAVGTGPLIGASMFAWGQVHAAIGDLDDARRRLEDAVDCFQQHGAPFEAARARMALARVLADRRSVAVVEARAARKVFETLGAVQELRRAASLLAELGIEGTPPRDTSSLPEPLTRRETEVLRLVARGKTNQQIADALFISVRTVERHISGIYGKLGLAGAAARASATVFAFEHGLARIDP